MTHRASRLVPAVLAGLLLVGCSGDDDQPVPEDPGAATGSVPDDASRTSEPAPTPDDGEQTGAPDASVTADSGAFRLRLPADWTDVRDQVDQEVEIAIRSEDMSDGFYTNVVVAREEPIADLEASLEQAAQDIAGEDGSYEVLDPVQVAGEPALGYTVSRTTAGVEIVQTQRWIQHGDHLYVVTLSVAASEADQGRAALGDVLDTWEWVD
jgi:hypothetical protein